MFIRCDCGQSIHVPPSTHIKCPQCHQEVKITTDNVTSFVTGEFRDLGITWTNTCKKCGNRVDPFPLWFEDSKSEWVACPICRGTLFGEYIPFLPLGGPEQDFKDYMFQFVVFCYQIPGLDEVSRKRVQQLTDLMISSFLNDVGQLEFEKVRTHWKTVADELEAIWKQFEQRGFIRPEVSARQRPIWEDLKETMNGVQRSQVENLQKTSRDQTISPNKGTEPLQSPLQKERKWWHFWRKDK